jgi:hypothetical protein
LSRRIAHRPRYRNIRQFIQPSERSRQHFFRTRWTYRRQTTDYEKHPLGYGLSLIPVPLRYRLMNSLIAQ